MIASNDDFTNLSVGRFVRHFIPLVSVFPRICGHFVQEYL